MSNHVNMIIKLDDAKLQDLIRDFKKFTAKTILEKIQTEPDPSLKARTGEAKSPRMDARTISKSNRKSF